MKTIQWLVAATALSLSLPVFAASSTFDFTAANPASSNSGYNPYSTALNNSTIQNDYGNVLTFNATGGTTTGVTSTVNISAYASTGAVSGNSGAAAGVTFSGNTGQQVQQAITTYYSGNGLAITSANGQNGSANTYNSNAYGTNFEFSGCSGVTSTKSGGGGSGTGCYDNAANYSGDTNSNGAGQSGGSTDYQHAIDNSGAYEALLLSFSNKVTLTSFNVGFYSPSTGADTTVLYYTGAGTPSQTAINTALQMNSFSSLLSNGWSLAQGSQYANDQSGTAQNPVTISVGQTAQYFMIGAYIPLVANQTPGNDNTPDYFKLKSIAVGSVGVPEPGSIALFGIAGAALFIGRRRKGARAV